MTSIRTLINLFESADGDAYFDPRAVAQAEQEAQNDRSRETLVYLSPDDFLRMAEPVRGGSGKAEGVADLLAHGKQFSSIPQLAFVHDGKGAAYVVGHEGRHRAMALRDLGVRAIPVILRSMGSAEGDAIRWGRQDDPFDKVDVLPTVLHGEGGNRGNTIPMPWSAVFLRPER